MTDKQRYQMERWKLLIEDDTRNEMKLKDWLKLRGITKDAYYYWLHKFQRENIDSALQELPVVFVPVIPEGLIKVVLYNIVKNRRVIDRIKREVRL